MKARLHAFCGGLALLCVAAFWSATVASELFGDAAAIVAVKRAILYAMAVLIPAMAAAGASGFRLAAGRGGRLVERKKKRMPFIAANGLLILLPSALFLHAKAVAGEFDAAFYAVQGLELLAGGINLALLGLNLRDGLALARRRAG